MKITKIEDIEHIELEQFSHPVFIEMSALSAEDLEKFRILDTPKEVDNVA